MRAMENAVEFLDGFIIKHCRGYSFYGLITPTELEEMAMAEGFYVANKVLYDGSVYLTAQKKHPPHYPG